ncbi:hypothetical protein FNF28_04982 [Cafeteria roenbergensis]|uniref:UBC core domain-containing protein n=2 Tax=Cafeteria roenbergensis TaxID=33653 RepID=A0A5A8D845_CAFRO|nr:hypothetical protein FNF28_04982 [Cafeteria roenbergensis]
MSLRGGSSAPLSKVAMRRLLTELESLARDPPPLISACPVSEERWHEWDCVIVGPDDTLYAGGAFRAKLLFPSQYPMQPPKMVFTSAMWHPNIYKGGDRDGEVCISALHPATGDPMTGETVSEQWSPARTIESILLSVQSILAEPNLSSPANVDAAAQMRREPDGFRAKVRETVRRSLAA